MHVSEYYGSPLVGEVYGYTKNDAGFLIRRKSATTGSFRLSNLREFFQAVFLPKGYPDSVSEDYLEYQIWDTLQAFCSSITRTLATQAVLRGSGVGDSTATVAGATITWLLKDGTGMVGRIAFAYFEGTSLDCNAKQWRIFADVLNDGATFIELLAVYLPKIYFTPVMCAAGLAYSIVGVAGGCTRAALTMHQARRNNMADVSSKDGSQETLVNLAALLTSLVITPLVADHFTTIWTLFVLFSMLHIYANYKAASSVVMEMFNRIRFCNVVRTFVSNQRYVMTPAEANKGETIFFAPSFSWLQLGCRLEDLELPAAELQQLLDSQNSSKFILKFDKPSGVVYVAFAHNATSSDVLRACYQSYLYHTNSTAYLADEDKFMKAIENAGWDISKQQLCPDEWRWTTDKAMIDASIENKHKYI